MKKLSILGEKGRCFSSKSRCSLGRPSWVLRKGKIKAFGQKSATILKMVTNKRLSF